MKESILRSKAISFAIRCIKLYKYLSEDKKEFIISKQLLRSGTAIGALIHEAQFAESTADFIHKLHISLKEANETGYWLLLLKETEFIKLNEYESIYNELEEILRLLVSSINTAKLKKKQNSEDSAN